MNIVVKQLIYFLKLFNIEGQLKGKPAKDIMLLLQWKPDSR